MSVIATGVTGTSYSDSGLFAGTPYTYTVAGVNSAGTGLASASATATTQSSGGTNVFGVQASGNKIISTVNASIVNLIGSAAITTPLGFANNNKGRDYGWSQVLPAQWLAAVTATYNTLSTAAKPYGLINMIRVVVTSAQWMAYTGRDPFGTSAGNYYFVGTDSNGHAIYSGGPGGGLGGGPGKETAGDPTTYRNYIIEQVASINAAGFYALLDLHWPTPMLVSTGQHVLPAGQPAMLGPGDIAYYASIAQQFGNNPGVMVEGMNEPYGQNTATNYFPELVYDASILASASTTGVPYPSASNPNGLGVGYLMMNNFANSAATVPIFGGTDPQTGKPPQCYAVGHQACLNAFRAAGGKNIYWAGPPNFSGEFRNGSGGNLWLQMGLTDSLHNLGCSWHCYNSAVTSASFDQVQAAGFPVLMTEMGNIDSESSYTNERAKNRGYTWWGWNNYGSSANPFSSPPAAPWTFGNGEIAPTGSN
jgi:Cellulase (glycosyl hydrolase family 5)